MISITRFDKELEIMQDIINPVKGKKNAKKFNWTRAMVYDRKRGCILATNQAIFFILKLDKDLMVFFEADDSIKNSKVNQVYCTYVKGELSLTKEGPGQTPDGELDLSSKIPDPDDLVQIKTKLTVSKAGNESVTSFRLSEEYFDYDAASLEQLLPYPISLKHLRALSGLEYEISVDMLADPKAPTVFKNGDLTVLVMPFNRYKR